jgi:cell division protein FtsB
MIKKFLIFLTILALLSTMLLPLLTNIAHATDIPIIPQPDFIPGPSQGSTGSVVQDYALNSGIPKALNIGIGLLGIGAFLSILISAIQMLTAYGKEDQINRAKTNLRYSLLGFLISILAYGIVSIVVSIALPNSSGDAAQNTEESSFLMIPTAYAVDVNEDINYLMPDEKSFIEDHDAQGRVSLPNGDFLGEVVPAVVTNIMYMVGFLIFIALIYGGTLMVIGRGNEEEVGKAKNIILYSAIALVLVSLGYALIYGIATLQLNNDATDNTDEVFSDTNPTN